MAPIRRYLRITKYSVLEVRIYLDKPSLAQSWLLNPRFNALDRIIQAVRPLVLPKLREENERATKGKGPGAKGKKAKGVKDVVHDEDFEVSIFLTDVPTRHSLLTKQKEFRDAGGRMKSNSSRLTGWVTTGMADQPINVDKDDDVDSVVIRQESDEEDGNVITNEGETEQRRSKRRREDSDDGLFVGDDISEDEGFRQPPSTLSKRVRAEDGEGQEEEDDKKKLGMKMSYDGFSIYGRVLCLVVKRKGVKSTGVGGSEPGQRMLENWVSTQAAQEQLLLDDE